MDYINLNHLIAIVCIIGILVCLGVLIYDHFTKEQTKIKPVPNLFKKTKTPRSRKRKTK